MPPNTMPRLSRPLRAGASTGLVLLAIGCTSIPAHVYPPADERELVVTYDFDGAPRPIEVPASHDGLSILYLRSDPDCPHESFSGGRRYLHPTADRLVLRCRYRALQGRDDRGAPLPLPAPTDLFPDATSVRTVWHRGQPLDAAPQPPALPH